MVFDISSYDELKQKLSLVFKDNKIPHAIIIEGGDFKERKMFSLLIAKWAICVAKFKACDKCSACKKVDSNNHPDITIEHPESRIKSIPVDTIRNIRKDAYIIPNEANYKVYILEESDNLSLPSSNALLKILEEPPKNVIFILTCSSAVSLIETIRSRCQTFSIRSKESNKDIEKENIKTLELSNKIAEAIIDTHEFNLLSLTASFIKNKTLFGDILDALESIFRETLLISVNIESSGSISDTARKLSNKLTKSAIITLLEEIKSFRKMLSQNANMSILITCFCQRMRKASIL